MSRRNEEGIDDGRIGSYAPNEGRRVEQGSKGIGWIDLAKLVAMKVPELITYRKYLHLALETLS